jgi:hypothetical protein
VEPTGAGRVRVLDLRLGGRTLTLHEGDAVASTVAVVTGWANPGERITEALWVLQSQR